MTPSTESKKNIPYTEWVPTGKLVKMIIFITLLFTVLVTTSVAWINPIRRLEAVLVFSGTTGFITLLYYNFRGLNIHLTSNQLEVKYGYLNRQQIPLDTVKTCYPIQIRLSNYGGLGVRLGFDGSLAYTTATGNGVKIVPHYGKPFVFSSQTPDQLCGIIQEFIHSSP